MLGNPWTSAASGTLKGGQWGASAASAPLRFLFGAGKGGPLASISSIIAPSFYFRGRQRRTQGEHQQHQGPFVSHLQQAKANNGRASAASGPLRFTFRPDYWRASAASSPLRFTFGVGRGRTQGEHQQHQGPFVSRFPQAKANNGRASAASGPLRFSLGQAKANCWRASAASLLLSFWGRQRRTTGEHQQHHRLFVLL